MSDTVYEFNKSLSLGTIGEKIVLNWLYSIKDIDEIVDVRKDKKYQKIDVDFLAYIGASIYKLEVKTDSYPSGNIYYETISYVDKNNKDVPGCMEKTRADLLLYYFEKFDELFIIKMPKYRLWFKKAKALNKIGALKTVRNTTFTSYGYAFPRELIAKEPWCKVIKNVKMEEKS